jgi:hypothetical protein
LKAKRSKERYSECLRRYSNLCLCDSKRFSDTDGGKAEQCELIISLLEFNLKSTVMSEFDAARHKAERKQKSPPEITKLLSLNFGRLSTSSLNSLTSRMRENVRFLVLRILPRI